MIVRKELMRPSEDQPKLNRRLNEHVWHALWHALGDITGKTGPRVSLVGVENLMLYVLMQ